MAGLTPEEEAELKRLEDLAAGPEMSEEERRLTELAGGAGEVGRQDILRLPSFLATGAANLAGVVAAPVLGPAMRPSPGDPGYEEFAREWEQSGFLSRLGGDIGRSVGAVRGGLETVGGPSATRQPETFLETVVEEIPGAIAGGGLASLAAKGIARATAGAAGRFGQGAHRVASTIGSRPGLVMAESATSVPGAVGARQATEAALGPPTNPHDQTWAEWLGRGAAMFGAEVVGGSMSSAMLRPVTRRLPGITRFSQTTPEAAPIVDPSATIAVSARRLGMMAASRIDETDNAIIRILSDVNDSNLSEAAASTRLQSGLLSARDYSARQAQRLYDLVDRQSGGLAGSPGGLRDSILDMLAEARARPGEIQHYPINAAERVLRQLRAGTDPQGRPIWRTDVTVGELNRLRSTLLKAEVVTTEGTTLPQQRTRELNANIRRLIAEADNSIEAVAANNPQYYPLLRQANDYYHFHNERFTRGPIGEFLETSAGEPLRRSGQGNVPGTERIAPTLLARELISPQRQGAEAVHQALNLLVANGTRPDLANIVAQGVRGRAEDALRAVFERDVLRGMEARMSRTGLAPEMAEAAGVTGNLNRNVPVTAVAKAQEFMERNRPLIENWTRVTADMSTAVRRADFLRQLRDRQTRSLAGRFIDGDPMEVIRTGLRTSNPRQAFRQLFQMSRGNPDILEGFKRSVIDLVFEGYGANPATAMNRMHSPAYRAALEEVFRDSPQDLARLFNLVRDVNDFLGVAVSATARGEARFLPDVAQAAAPATSRIRRWANTYLAHIAGLVLGGRLANLLPGGGSAASLSLPALMSRTFRDVMANHYAANPEQALALMRDAALNPILEARLRDALPGNFNDARYTYNRTMAWVRRMMAVDGVSQEGIREQHGRELMMEERRKRREVEDMFRENPFK